MTQRKMHYQFPSQQVHGRNGTLETITIARPPCNANIHYRTMTADKEAVTCQRCRVYLDRIESWEKERTRPKLKTDEIERLMLDVLCDRCETQGMRYTLDRLIREHPPVYAALLSLLRDEVDRYWQDEQARQSEEETDTEEVTP